MAWLNSTSPLHCHAGRRCTAGLDSVPFVSQDVNTLATHGQASDTTTGCKLPAPAPLAPRIPKPIKPTQSSLHPGSRARGEILLRQCCILALPKVAAFIRDVRLLLKLRPLGLLMRFVKGNSSAYFGKSEDSVDIEWVFLRANDATTPRLDEDVLEELEQMMVFKYGGEPRTMGEELGTFLHRSSIQVCSRLQEFLEVKAQLDPQDLFSNPWTDPVLAITGVVTEVKPFCALEGLCICSADVHCAPEAGNFCRPGLVYKQARVCRF